MYDIASSWTDEDVIVHTSLPPKVDGQLRCFLKLCVREVIWLVANAPELTHVRVVWWGEDGNGTIFRFVRNLRFLCFSENLNNEIA